MSEKRRKSVKIEKIDDGIDFNWGKKRGRGGKNKEFQFYESFRFDGVEYSLYDSVYLFKFGEIEPYVGKLIKIYEGDKNDKKVKILWFFRPSDISNYLQGVDALENELFLATGDGIGLTKVNPLEAIAGKCNVVCISKDDRNRLPFVEELEMADYVFYRTFDVQHLTVTDKLDEKIAMVDVKLLLNKNDPQSADLAVTAAKPLIPDEDTLVADRLVDSNTKVDSTVLVRSEEKKAISHKDARDVEDDVKCDAGLGSSLVKEDKPSIEKGDAPKPDNTSVVPSTSKRVLKSGQETTSTSPDLKQTRLKKVDKGAVAVTAADNGQSEPVNDVKRCNDVAGNFKPQDRLSKKPKLDGSARKTIVSGGTSTQKSGIVSPANNKASEPTGSAAETNVGGKLTRVSSGLSDTPLRKQTDNGVTPVTDEKTSDKSNKASEKLAKDSQNFVNKATERRGEVSKSNGSGKLSRERDGTSEGVSKKRRTNSLIEHKPNDKLGKVSNKQPYDDTIGAYNQVKEVTQPPHDRSKWFTGGLWEDRMKDAYDQEKLVLLQNLDPTYSSTEVEKIVWLGFQENCEAHVVQRTATSSPHSGQAFAIFNTREVAQKVIRKLEQDCLMLPNRRPLVGTIDIMKFPLKQSQFFGHLVIDKKLHMSQKDAVSTSHSAQPNTIEFEMALDWRLLQDRSFLWWEKLHQKQEDDIKKLQARLKSN